jgi:DNA-directed RNA polymerase I, II, and III subunit RPABC1
MSSDKRTKLFRIRKTVSKMLNARGYLVSQKELDRDKDSFTEDFGEDPRRETLTLMVPKRDDPSENVSNVVGECV